MRREDVRPLLKQAARRLPEPDLADDAWAGGLAIRRRRRRGTATAGVVVLLVIAAAALVAGLSRNGAEVVPPDTVPNLPPGYVRPTGQISGIDFWVAPPSGSERFLDRMATPLGDSLRVPLDPAELESVPLQKVAAVLLSETDGTYTPLLLGADSRWVAAAIELDPIASGPPLSSGAVSPDGRLVAFPQPRAVVVVNATTADIYRFSVPTEDLRSVSWLPDSARVLVSGPTAAYRVLVGPCCRGEQSVAPVQHASDPDAATAPYRLDGGVGRVGLRRYSIDGGWTLQDTLQLPASSWVGQTSSAGATAARLFVADQLPQVQTTASRPQVVAAVSTEQTSRSRLLVLGETPAATPPPTGPAVPDAVRTPGCCFVLGWYDSHTALLQVAGWVLAWDVQTGRVRRVTELEVDSVALGPGITG
jgi:hypothetical protein